MKHSTENNTGEMKANGTHCNVQKATREREKSTAEALNSRVEPRLETTEQLLYSHRTFTVWMDKCSRRSSSNSKGIKKKSKTSIEERAIARSSILTFFCSFSLPFLFCLSLARSLFHSISSYCLRFIGTVCSCCLNLWRKVDFSSFSLCEREIMKLFEVPAVVV